MPGGSTRKRQFSVRLCRVAPAAELHPRSGTRSETTAVDSPGYPGRVSATRSTSPLIDGTGDGYLLTETRARLVALTPARSQLFVEAAAEGRRVVLVSDEQTTLTEAYRDLMTTTGGRWVVRSGVDDLRDGMTGRSLASIPAVLATSAAGVDTVAPRFLNLQQPDTTQFVFSASVRHRADDSTRLGRVAETFAALGGASTPAAWGTHEPADSAWNKTDLTAFLRSRMPLDTRVLVSGSAHHPFQASIVARRTAKGVEEITTGVVGVGAPGSPEVLRAFEAAPSILADLTAWALPLVATVFVRVGERDLGTRPFVRQDPEPVALLVGAPGVRELGLDVADLVQRFGATAAGRPRVPALVFGLREFPPRPRDSGWTRLEEVVEALGSGAVENLTGVRLRRPTQTEGAESAS